MKVTEKGIEAVLVSWVSVNHRSGPVVTAIRDPQGALPGKVHRLYLCWRDAPPPEGDRERDAVRETVAELREQLGPACPEIVKLPWKTTESPTAHAAIRSFAEGALRRVRDESPDATVVIHLSPGTPAMHAVWLTLGSTGFLSGQVKLIQTADQRGLSAGQQPVQIIQFDLDTWLRHYRTARPEKTGNDDDGHIWDPARVRSGALREALSRLEEWAPLRVPVLLTGERGTGKTTLANFLRSMSPFQKARGKGWPTVVCGQFRVSPQLARSELFGHVAGAFTDAKSDRMGLLEEADGDTVFFDEIADIDRDTQRLLMAAIEGRGFQRVGDSRVRNSSFRLVCATNRSLSALRRDVLDLDFFDRIAVFVLAVPPLRQCREDLPDAWRQVLTLATRSVGVATEGHERFLDHPALMKAFTGHPLPGNFRDLQRAAYHLLAALKAGRPEARILQGAIEALGPPTDVSVAAPDLDELAARLPLQNLNEQLAAYERSWLLAALKKAGGTKAHAARLLGIPRKTFESRLRSTRDGDEPDE